MPENATGTNRRSPGALTGTALLAVILAAVSSPSEAYEAVATGMPVQVQDAGDGAVPPDAVADVATLAADLIGPATPAPLTRDLYLEVSINGAPTGLVAAFHEAEGVLLIEDSELREVGILPVEAARMPDGRIRIDRLPGVTYGYDEVAQRIDFTASDAERAARIIDTEGSKSLLGATGEPAPALQSGHGALLNYSLFAASGEGPMRELLDFQGVSGSFEGRMFSPYGVFAQTFVASTASGAVYDSTRLDTSWSYSDPASLRSYRAGDLITGGLDWTRPTRLAGFQVRKNFQLRSDLVTMPVPEFSGSAAVPSTVDVYLNGARRFSQDIDAGPFSLTNLPVVTGAGTARVVVRDAAGQEKVSESSFFASSKLLARGLVDYSAEIGFGRKFFGTESADYDRRLMGSASMRYGVTDWLTAEAHAEGGEDLANGGVGAVFAVGSLGTVSVSAAGSHAPGQHGERDMTGMQFGASAEFEVGGATIQGRVQRTYDDYHDIASIIDASTGAEDGLFPVSVKPPKAINQVALSLPLDFDPSSINLSFTEVETFDEGRQSVVGLSYSRNIMKKATVYVSGFKDLGSEVFGLHAGLTIPLGEDYVASSSASSGADGVQLGASLSRRGGQDVGEYAWQIRDSEGETARRSALAEYRAGFAELAGGLSQSGETFRATAQMDGAVIAAGRDVFFSKPIDDAFAIVDVGVKDVEVQHENRPVGRTNAKGKLLLPNLRAFERNRISIDPQDLPLDTTLSSTREIVIPADRSGVVVAFDGSATGSAALVTFRDEAGAYLALGAAGRAGEGGEFVVGYDGQAFVEGLGATNRIVVELPDGARCTADFAYAAKDGAQVSIPDAICRATP